MTPTLWHDPRCSTSRRTLALLQDQGYAPAIRLYLQDPPDAAEINGLCLRLGLRPIDLVRQKEPDWAALGLDPGCGDAQVLAALAANPRLLQRPILSLGNRAALGRPPEAVLAIL